MNDNSVSSNDTTDREAQLYAIIEAQEARLNAIADLVAHVRHGINNPLTGILGQAQLLLRKDLPEDIHHCIESIEQLAIRTRDMAAMLRNIQRPVPHAETGKLSSLNG